MINTSIIQSIKVFQNGLTSFFNFLQDSKRQVEPIVIEADDEISIMAKEVNSNIQTSIELHNEIEILMNAMNKYVITSETDPNGTITHVSEAFCKASGYEKDELIGKSHNILKHPNMDDKIFKDLWETIKEYKIGKVRY
jgi:PAS domain-containing protein